MQIKPLYRYERESWKVTVSPVKPEDKPYTEMYRLIADEGKVLSNGDIQTTCTDVESADGWEEIDEPEEEGTDDTEH